MYTFPLTEAGELAAKEVSGHIVFGVDDIKVYTDEDMPQITKEPIQVSRRQMFLALHQLGYLDAVQNWRNTQATEIQAIEFDAAGEFASDWSTLLQAAQALGFSHTEVLTIFNLAQVL